MADKYQEMVQQMRADGVDETMIARFVAEEMREDEFRRGRGTTDIEAARLRKNMPESIRQLLLGNAFCPNCGVKMPADAQFCAECGTKKPAGEKLYKCDKCGWEPEDPAHPPKFCPECGDVFDDSDVK